MKKSFMTRVLATGLSLAMAFSMAAATNVTTASAASKPAMITYDSGASAKTLSVKLGEATKIKVNAATKKTYKVSAVKVSSSKLRAAKNTAGTVVTIRGLKATEEGKPASVKVSFQVRKTGKTSKYSYVSKVNVIEDKLTMTAAATKVKQITVNFNKAVDTTKAVIAITKGAAKPTVTSTTFAADAKSAEIVMGTKLTEGTYTVTVTGLTDTALTADIAVENEKLTKFELVSANLVADATNTTEATISYKALNQYDEMMVANQPEVTCTFGKTPAGNVTAPSADKSGTVKVTDINTALAIPGTVGTIVIVDKTNGVNLNTSVTYQSKAVASTATVYGIYSTKTDKLIEGNLATGAKAADYSILMSIKDQYGSDMTPKAADASADVTYNVASVLTDLTVDGTKVVDGLKELSYDGANAFLIPLKSTDANGKINKAGKLSLTIVSTGKGVLATPSFTIDEAKIIKTLSVAPASTIYAGEDNALVVEAYDANGDAITKFDDLNAAGLSAESNVQTGSVGGASAPLTLKKNADGTGTLYFNPKNTFISDTKNQKESSIGTIVIKANSATSSDYLVKTVNVTYYEKREPWAVAGKTDKTVTACAVSGSLKLDLTTLAYEDQYSNTVKANEGTVPAATSAVEILLVDKNGIFGTKTTDVGRALVAGEKDGNNVVLSSVSSKGDATLYFRYKTDSRTNTLTDDTGDVSVDKYDLKLTISATPVTDMVTSDLKLVVNKGEAIYASKDVEIAKFNTTTTDVTQQNGFEAANEGTAYVYVTGVVNGKTVVIPSSQYTIVTKKISGLGAYNAKDNAKTETKTITVVVDSESGSQTLTSDVTVSNLPRAITKLKERATSAYELADITSKASQTVSKSALLAAVKVMDQYGNEMTQNADLQNSFTYKVEFTGANAKDDNYEIKYNSSQDISIKFKNDLKYDADVTFTTLDGKVSFTKAIKVEVKG